MGRGEVTSCCLHRPDAPSSSGFGSEEDPSPGYTPSFDPYQPLSLFPVAFLGAPVPPVFWKAGPCRGLAGGLWPLTAAGGFSASSLLSDGGCLRE